MHIIPEEGEKYDDYISRVLQARDNVRDKQHYQEQHHIVPKCMGGNNEESNLVYLYAQEHYYAHKLLALENPQIKGLQYAWWNMCQFTQNHQREYEISADEYEKARIQFSNMMRGNSYARGQTLSAETRQKQREAHKGKCMGAKNGMYGKHCSEQCKEKLRKKLSGANNPSAKSVKCIETEEVFSTVKQAAEQYKISHSDIAACIGGRQKSAGKHPITKEKLHWQYI